MCFGKDFKRFAEIKTSCFLLEKILTCALAKPLLRFLSQLFKMLFFFF